MTEDKKPSFPAETVPNAPVETGLTIQDLNLVLQIIQVSSSRGAFKAGELALVGGLHDRIYKFLDDTGALAKTATDQQ